MGQNEIHHEWDWNLELGAPYIEIWAKMRSRHLPVLVSIVASIPACHVGDQGSIPWRGGLSFENKLGNVRKTMKRVKIVNRRVCTEQFAVEYANLCILLSPLYIFLYFRCNSAVLCTYVVEICVLYMYFTTYGIMYVLCMYFMHIAGILWVF